MRVIVTCGPSWEPVDDVRRLTNFSTGELGLRLSAALSAAGHEVVCLRGELATARLDSGGAEVVEFSTNDDLLRKLALRGRWAEAVFHAAALCDFTVRREPGGVRKIPSRTGELSLVLEPAPKILPRLRELFPAARITGWKYELDGTRDDVLAKAHRQIEEARTDACVVNGAAWGNGFALVRTGAVPAEAADKGALCTLLAGWLGGL